MRDWLSIEALRKTYPGPIVALDDVSLAVGEGEFFAIVGPSNAGKSTLLKTIAGVELPDLGSMSLANRNLATLEPRERRLSLLFQNIALFPNRTGYENIAFPMRVAKHHEAKIRTRVAEVAELLKINEKTAYKLASAGKIPGFKVGGSWRFQRQEIANWIKRKVEEQREGNGGA